MVNSTIITVTSLIALVTVGSSAAYYLARARTRLSYGLYLLFLLGIVLPFQLALVPLYAFMKDTGLLGSYTSMILFYTGLQMPFTVFLYTGLPARAAARVRRGRAGRRRDAAAELHPRHVPAAAAGHRHGGDPQRRLHLERLRTPLVYLGGTPNETIPVVVYQFVGQYTPTGATMFAAVVMASLPILVVFVLLQRYVIKGFSSGVKG